tara:strand:+ start:569 stop:748 length:180 start_codon:yes stop_codon:yes gene_type:complete
MVHVVRLFLSDKKNLIYQDWRIRRRDTRRGEPHAPHANHAIIAGILCTPPLEGFAKGST